MGDEFTEAAAREEKASRCLVNGHALQDGFRQLSGKKRGRVGPESIRHPVHYRITEGACKSLSATSGGQLALPLWVLLWTQHGSQVQCLLCKKGPLPVSGLVRVCPRTPGFLEEVRNITDPYDTSVVQHLKRSPIATRLVCRWDHWSPERGGT